MIRATSRYVLPACSNVIALRRRFSSCTAEPIGLMTTTVLEHCRGVCIISQNLDKLPTQIVPGSDRIAYLASSPLPSPAAWLAHSGAGSPAATLRVQLQLFQIQEPGELQGAFAAMSRDRMKALKVGNYSLIWTHRATVVELAAQYQLPTAMKTETTPMLADLSPMGCRTLISSAGRPPMSTGFSRRRPWRSPRAAADEVRARHKLEDREDAQADHPGVGAGAGRMK